MNWRFPEQGSLFGSPDLDGKQVANSVTRRGIQDPGPVLCTDLICDFIHDTNSFKNL